MASCHESGFSCCPRCSTPTTALFEYSAIDNNTFQISSLSSINPDHLAYFHFVGRVVGTALFHGKLLDSFFTQPFDKRILGQPPSLKNIKAIDPEHDRSLKWILDNDPEPLDLSFSVEQDQFDEITTVNPNLRENRENIPVSEENKEYVKLVVEWRLQCGVSEQFKCFLKGLHEITPHKSLRIFDEKELELLIAGLGEIDTKDWRVHAWWKPSMRCSVTR